MNRNERLSPEMRDCIKYARETGGELKRYAGGFWAASGPHPQVAGRRWFGTVTIQALVRRDRLVYAEWKYWRGGRFPIAARLPGSQPSPGEQTTLELTSQPTPPQRSTDKRLQITEGE